MKKYIINGGRTLCGEVEIGTAKNACLPLISAALAVGCEVFLEECADISDVRVQCSVAALYGVDCAFCGRGLTVDGRNADYVCAFGKDWKKVRASSYFLGAQLARFKKAEILMPGGCDIGARPLDIHLDAIKSLGAECYEFGDKLFVDGRKMRAGRVKLRYPSVGATVNALQAALFLKGVTVIENAAREPEIVCLCDFFNECGCRVFGAGQGKITVIGTDRKNIKKRLKFLPIKDRIEAATFSCAVCACGGAVSFAYDDYSNLFYFFRDLKKAGCEVVQKDGKVVVKRDKKRIAPVCAVADVYPALPTDAQPPLCAALLKADGESCVRDRVYPDRFRYCEELKKIGGVCSVRRGVVRITGVKELVGGDMTASDLRGGAALVIAALSAGGTSSVAGVSFLERGYENLQCKLANLGADIKREERGGFSECER